MKVNYSARGWLTIDSPSLIREKLLNVYKNGSMNEVMDLVVIEKHLHLRINETDVADLVCSPQAYRELAIGYLLSENILNNYQDLRKLDCDEQQQIVNVFTDKPWVRRKDTAFRQVNSCAGRGQQGLQTNTEGIEPVKVENVFFSPGQIFSMVTEMENRGDNFHLSGGTHSAALGCQGKLLVSYEDIGRHNAVDKVFGYAFLNQIPLDDKCLVLSGRIASEILLKAARSHIPLVISRSAATGLAVGLAEELGITIVGFTRGDRFNVYCHKERIKI